MKIAIITGASQGIGREFALQLDRMLQTTDEIWLIARNKEKLDETAKMMRNNTRVIPLDLTDSFSLEALEIMLEENKPSIRFLVNAAGFGLLGDFDAIPIAEQEKEIELNCKALTRITRSCIPYMSWNGRIIQVASSAAFLPQPQFAVYAATKSYVLSFSRALASELKGAGIYVTAVCPGPVDTEFFERAEKYGKNFGLKAMIMANPYEVVKKAIRDSYFRRQTSVYSITILGFELMAKFIPHSVLLAGYGLLKKFDK